MRVIKCSSVRRCRRFDNTTDGPRVIGECQGVAKAIRSGLFRMGRMEALNCKVWVLVCQPILVRGMGCQQFCADAVLLGGCLGVVAEYPVLWRAR